MLTPIKQQDDIATPMKNPETALREVFGFEGFRDRQCEIIDRIIDGDDAFVVMPTGGGKSLCYQIPSLVREGIGIVISPLISLMDDQVHHLQKLGIRASALHSGQDREVQRVVRRDMEAGVLDLLYVSPERLGTQSFRDALEKIEIALFAVDEAHCITQWGHDFRPEYLRITELRKKFAQVPCVAVTATADAPTRQEILERLLFRNEDLFVSGFDRPNIKYTVVPKKNWKMQLLQFLKEEHPSDCGIVYCLSRKRVEKVATWLTDQGFVAIPYHAGLNSSLREANQNRFLNEEGLIVVATIAFGLGIDKANVRFVAHLDLPRSVEAYYQETGRAGRDGLPADAWMAYGLSDVVNLERIIKKSEGDDSHVRRERHRLTAMVKYCETPRCRRRMILNHFGQESPNGCPNCDNCLDPVEMWKGTAAAQLAISCVQRTGQRFGAGHIIDVLLGRKSKKVLRFQHETTSVFGSGVDIRSDGWHSILRQLVAQDVIKVDTEAYGALKLGKSVSEILRGDREIMLKKEPARRRAIHNPSSRDRMLAPGEQKLFEALRSTRLDLARKQGIPAYRIFHDSTLIDMSRKRPTDLEALGKISGVGKVKKERYGDPFLKRIRAHAL